VHIGKILILLIGLVFLAIALTISWSLGLLPSPFPEKPVPTYTEVERRCLAAEIWHAASREEDVVQLLVGIAAINLHHKTGQSFCTIFTEWRIMRPAKSWLPRPYVRQLSVVEGLTRRNDAERAAHAKATQLAERILGKSDPAELLPKEHAHLKCVWKVVRNWQSFWATAPGERGMLLAESSDPEKPIWVSPGGTEFFCPANKKETS